MGVCRGIGAALRLSRLAALTGLPFAAAISPGAAQSITIDGSLSPARTLSGPNYTIGADLGKQVGGNLFQSFGRFGLANGESATFAGPASVMPKCASLKPSIIAGGCAGAAAGGGADGCSAPAAAAARTSVATSSNPGRRPRATSTD